MDIQYTFRFSELQQCWTTLDHSKIPAFIITDGTTKILLKNLRRKNPFAGEVKLSFKKGFITNFLIFHH